MANWLTIKRLSEKYGITETTLRGWKTLGYVTSSTIDDIEMLDDDSLTLFLDIHQTKGVSEDSLYQIIKEKEWEREILLSQMNDELFLLKTQSLYQPLFHIIIQELGNLITNDHHRDLFLAISCGEPVSRVAARYGVPYGEVIEKYNNILKKLGENGERIATYRNRAMTLLFGKYNTDYPTNISLTQILNERARHVLKKQEIETVHQLLQYTARCGWPSLKHMEGMGALTYKDIISALFHANFIVIHEDKSITLSPEIAALVLE